jgi:MFS family permease
LGARGLAISFILAAPRFAGVLRLGVPALIARLQRRKAICIAAYLASAVVLCGVPALAVARSSLDARHALTLVIAAWCIYHLLEYFGTVALWSWLGDLTPRRIRGRLLGKRERALVLGRIAGICGSGAIALTWSSMQPNEADWPALSISAATGAVMMLLATIPLAAMPAIQQAPSAVPRRPWRSLAGVLVDRPYRRLLAFSCWFALASGFVLSAQNRYQVRELEIPYVWTLALSSLMWAGQSVVAPRAGRLTDRYGNRPVMIVSLLVASTGLLFFLAATPQAPWPFAGAYLVWIAYAGLNVGLDNSKLKFASADNNMPYVATYHSVSDFANGIAIICGGLLYDRLVAGGSDALQLYAQLFFWGWVARTSAVVFLARLIEPEARRLGEPS